MLVFQNRKLAQQLETQKDKEDELQKRINDMQQLQALNDDTLATVNKFWIQVNFSFLIVFQLVVYLNESKMLEMFCVSPSGIAIKLELLFSRF